MFSGNFQKIKQYIFDLEKNLQNETTVGTRLSPNLNAAVVYIGKMTGLGMFVSVIYVMSCVYMFGESTRCSESRSSETAAIDGQKKIWNVT